MQRCTRSGKRRSEEGRWAVAGVQSGDIHEVGERGEICGYGCWARWVANFKCRFGAESSNHQNTHLCLGVLSVNDTKPVTERRFRHCGNLVGMGVQEAWRPEAHAHGVVSLLPVLHLQPLLVVVVLCRLP